MIKDHDSLIKRQVQALTSLNGAIPVLQKDAMSKEKLEHIIEKELFSPAEDEEMAFWFSRFISLRHNLWAVVDTAINNTGGVRKLSEDQDWRYFVLGYSAVCSLVRLDRFLLNKVAYHTLIQRKLNEAFPDHRIERKQYSDIYKELLLPANAVRIHEAHRKLKKKHKVIAQAVEDSSVEPVFRKLPQQERFIDLRWRRYFFSWLASRQHAWRRRGASARQKSIFTVLEYSGRVASELALPRVKKVTPTIRAELQAILQPGDIFVTRHNRALTNLFLPGYWPHAALYVGHDTVRQQMGISADPQHLKYWSGDHCTFEALKDGVHFRTLNETLNVDAFVVIRPNFSVAETAQALSRVVTHAGKDYNFDFDFFRSDQLVCTEVIYRAFDGINGIDIPLKERMGRKTLSAEDLIDLALDTGWGQAIAIFGTRGSKKSIITGALVNEVLKKSYRDTA